MIEPSRPSRLPRSTEPGPDPGSDPGSELDLALTPPVLRPRTVGPLGEPAPQPPPETLVDPSGRPPELAVAVDLVDEELSEADHAIPDDIERPPSEPDADAGSRPDAGSGPRRSLRGRARACSGL